MLKIGDFSKLSCISIRMLRYYDEHNMLKPTFIDANTNYRFYNVKQLEIANIINKLRSLGFSNKIIAEILDKKDMTNINNYLKNKIDELQSEISKINKTSKELELLINDDFNQLEYNVIKKIMPKRKVVSLRKIIPTYMDENILWNELFNEIKKEKISVSENGLAIAIYHDLEYKEHDVDIEVQVSVDGDYQDNEIIKFYTTNEIEIASITFNGSYDKMPYVTTTAMRWMGLNNYELIQPTFNIFHISPEQDKNENNFVTESCFQIKKDGK